MSVNAHLRTIAKALPPVPDPAKQHMAARRAGKGKHLLATGKAKGMYRQNDKYTRPLPFVGVDHFKELRKAWDIGKMDAVNEYVNQVRNRVPTTQAEKIIQRMPLRQRIAARLAKWRNGRLLDLFIKIILRIYLAIKNTKV